jgi:hypothetical protein
VEEEKDEEEMWRAISARCRALPLTPPTLGRRHPPTPAWWGPAARGAGD